MAVNLTVNGTIYQFPEANDPPGWGTNVADWATAVSQSTLQKTGGSFVLSNELDLGPNYGVKSLYIATRTANPASTGILRLARADAVNWRNEANDGDLSLSVNSSDELLWDGTKLTRAGEIVNADVAADAAIAQSKLNLSITNAEVDASAAVAYSKLALTGSIVNADVASGAAIAVSKLEALTGSRAVQLSAGGVLEASAVTSTELGYLDGVTSAVQTQLDGKTDESTLTTKGDLYVATADSTVTRLGVGTNNQVLVADSAEASGVKWTNQASTPPLALNVVMNGAMEIAQRGTSFPAASHSDTTLDRWRVFNTLTTAVMRVDQSSESPGVVDEGYFFNNSQKVSFTTADASPGVNDYAMVAQHIEGYIFKAIAQRPFTLSFWVRSSKTGTYVVQLRNDGLDRQYTTTYTVNSADTWEKKEITFPASPSGGTWNYTNDIGLRLNFTLASGADREVDAADFNAWQTVATGTLTSGEGQVNLMDSTSNEWYLTGVQINPGGSAADFTLLGKNYAGELAACKRYFERATQSVWINGALTLSSSRVAVQWFFTEKRGTPSMSESSGECFRVANASFNVASQSIFSRNRVTSKGVEYIVDFSGTPFAGSNIPISSWVNDEEYIDANAELT